MLSLLKPLVWEPGPAKLAALATGADRPMSAAVPTASAKARFLTDMLCLPPLNRMILHAETALLFVFKRLPYRTINRLGGMFESTRRRYFDEIPTAIRRFSGRFTATIAECRRNAAFSLTGGKRKDQRKSRLGTVAATRSGRRTAGTRLTAPPVRSIRPWRSRAGASVAIRRWRCHTWGGQMTFTRPVSSSRLMNTTPRAVGGRCRWGTRAG